MKTHNAANERIKRKYCVLLKDAKGQSEATVDAVTKAIARFEESTGRRDFKAFHFEQARAFKRHLMAQNSLITGGKLAKSTIYATLSHLKRFFQWLALQPGYRSKLQYSDAEYFSPSDGDVRVATAHRKREFPTVDQVRHVIGTMPAGTEIERRDRALIALILLTGARDSAVASLKLKHVNLVDRSIYQDARDVRTKFSKSFTTYFFSVSEDVEKVFVDWVDFLRSAKAWLGEYPLFPATLMEVGSDHQFRAAGLKPEHWSSPAPIRRIFREAFNKAGLPYFHPHSLRHTLAHLGEETCQSPEQFKAWSQNLGHEGVLTTFMSYGAVAPHRQREIISGLGKGKPKGLMDSPEEFAAEVVRLMRAGDIAPRQEK